MGKNSSLKPKSKRSKKNNKFSSRFADLKHDKRFRPVSKHHKKVEVDERFASALQNMSRRPEIDGFKNEDGLDRLYEMDPANKLNNLGNESEGESDSEDELIVPEEEIFYEEEAVVVPTIEDGEETRYLACCQLEWDKLRAVDLLHFFRDIVAMENKDFSKGIKSVGVYVTNYGREKLKLEAEQGPTFIESELPAHVKVNKNDDDYDTVLLRYYNMSRLKYYVALVECDSVEIADSLYANCDGVEFEHSSTHIDLRFVDDEQLKQFEGREVRDSATKLPKNYQPPNIFGSSGLGQTNPTFKWDDDDKMYQELIEKANKDELDDEGMRMLFGSDDESEKLDAAAFFGAGFTGFEDDPDRKKKEEEAEEPKAQRKKKKKVVVEAEEEPKKESILEGFEADLNDDRFKAAFANEDMALDPQSKLFRKDASSHRVKQQQKKRNWSSREEEKKTGKEIIKKKSKTAKKPSASDDEDDMIFS
ncbi:hypothetical protein PCE1_000055 [Barthelona sp. PCE]